MAFKMNGMNFGVGTKSIEPTMPEEIQPDPPMLKSEWGTNEAGYITKTKKGKNLFGRKREVTKYYDSETGKKLGKQVKVARGKGDPRPEKTKIKKVNPGLTQSGGVGKIRLKENPWESSGGSSKDSGEAINRQERAFDLKDANVTTNEKGQPELPDYRSKFNEMENKTVDGVTKKYNPRNKKYYDDSDVGLKSFEDDAEAWWDEQAAKTNNPKLKKQNQPYGREYDSPAKKLKRGFKMNSPLKNYKKGYYGIK